MKYHFLPCLIIATAALSGCQQTASSQPTTSARDTCGAADYQNLVGGPSSSVMGLNIPGDTRHYGSEESPATNNPSRLNFVHSGTAIESVTNPNSTIIRVFCG